MDPHRVDALSMSAFTEPVDSPDQVTALIPGASNPHFLGGAVRINEDGFRGPPLSTAGHARILAVGDSVTFGYGVEEDAVWEAVLAERLSTPGAPVEAVNAGLSGAGLRYYRGVVRDRCAALAPERVVVALVINDILPYPPPRGRPQVDRLGARLNRGAMRASHLYAAGVPLAKGLAYRTGVLDLDTNPGFAFLALEDPSPRQDRAWVDSLALLDDIVAETGACGAALTVVVFPVETQLSEDALRLYRDGLGLRIGAGAMDGLPQARLRAWADANGVDLVDLLPAYRAAAATGGPLFLRSDAVSLDPVHPSARGHAVAADVLAAHLAPPPVVGTVAER